MSKGSPCSDRTLRHCITYAYVYNTGMTIQFAKVPKTLGVSDFRAALADNLAKAKKSPLVISDRKGGDSFVVLSAAAYNKLVEAWEDEQDAAELAQLVAKNKGKKFYSLESLRPR